MHLTYLTSLLLPSLVASIAVPPSPASSSDGTIAPITAPPAAATTTLSAPAAPTDIPSDNDDDDDEVEDLELREIVTGPPGALPTPAAGNAPFITSWWAPTVLPDGVTTYVLVTFTQSYDAVPEQLPTPNKGVIGMGTLTGEVGVVRTAVPKHSGGGKGTPRGALAVVAGVMGVVAGWVV